MVLFLICHALNNWPILTSEQREMRLQWQLSSLFGASCHDQYISRKRLQNLWMLLLLPRRMGPLRRVAITSSQLLTIKHRTPGQGPLPFIVGPSPRLSPWEARPSVSQRLITWSIFIYSPPENLWARFIAGRRVSLSTTSPRTPCIHCRNSGTWKYVQLGFLPESNATIRIRWRINLPLMEN